MSEDQDRIQRLTQLRRLAQGLVLALLLTVGGGAGWSLGSWQDAALSSQSVLAAAEQVNLPPLPLPDVSAGPAVAEAESMPELAAEDEALALAVDELLTDAALLGLETVADALPTTDPYRAILDPRDRAPLSFALPGDPGESGQTQAGAESALEPLVPPGRRIGALVRYVVGPGDTLESIATYFGVSVAAVQSANELEPGDLLRAGQSLLVPTINGPVHVVRLGESLSQIATSYGVELEQVTSVNEIDGNIIMPGQRLLIPGGVRPALAAAPASSASAAVRATPALAPAAPAPPPPTARPAAPAPASAPSAPAAASAPSAPTPRPTARPAPTATPAAVLASRPAPASLPGGPLAWPLNGIVTQRFGENGHSGLDVAAPTGTTVKAAAAGTVIVAAKLSYGYGWRIVVDHGGYTTLYAHLSAFNVAEGARVARGQVVGAVGTTGLATGPHLHFEVNVGGRLSDPMKFLP